MPSINTPDNTPASQGGPRDLKILITPSHKAPKTPKSPEQPSPPPTPCPWLWRCHSCYTIYRLAVTRRCLDCDHTFCLGDAAGSSTAAAGLRGGKKRKRGGPCKAEFDYTGWKSRGAWRRTILLNGKSTKGDAKGGEGSWGDEHEAAAADELCREITITMFDDKREHLFVRKQHDCFLHCDFPSECHHALFRAQQAGRPVLREAIALDAAREAVAVAELDAGTGNSIKKKVTRRLTAQEVQEYKQERKKYRRGATAARFSPLPEDLLLLPAVDEADEEDNVSPCSPTSPDPPGDLTREVQQVSPIEGGDEEQLLPPVSPGGTTQHRRRSLLVATDTPADFATTAAPLCFDDNDEDTYSEDGRDGDDEGESEANKKRRTNKSRRKIAQLTGEEFGPFVFDTSSPSPTSPSGIITSVTHAANNNNNNNNPAAALDLQAAYSEQAWFSSSSSSTHFQPTTITTITAEHPPQLSSPRCLGRTGKRDRMLALLGRRAGGGPPSPTRSRSTREVDVLIDNVPAWRYQHHQPAPREGTHSHPQHESEVGGEWEDWSDSSSSSASTVSGPDTDADGDGDVAMRDAADAADDSSSPQAKDKAVDDDVDDEDSPVTPPGRQHGVRARGGEADEDLRVLLRMRNAFMRGEMR